MLAIDQQYAPVAATASRSPGATRLAASLRPSGAHTIDCCVNGRSGHYLAHPHASRSTKHAANKDRSVTAKHHAEELTAPVEDYLKAIYALERSGGSAATNMRPWSIR